LFCMDTKPYLSLCGKNRQKLLEKCVVVGDTWTYQNGGKCNMCGRV
jgi:hypothetical protein